MSCDLDMAHPIGVEPKADLSAGPRSVPDRRERFAASPVSEAFGRSLLGPETMRRCAAHVAALPDDGPQLRQLASWAALDLSGTFDDYCAYFVGTPTWWTAVDAFLTKPERVPEADEGGVVFDQLVLDALIWAAYPEMTDPWMTL